MWWVDAIIPRVLQAVSNIVIRSNNKVLMDAVEGAYRIVRIANTRGREDAAKSVFDAWDGVYWEAGGEREILEEVVDLEATVPC